MERAYKSLSVGMNTNFPFHKNVHLDTDAVTSCYMCAVVCWVISKGYYIICSKQSIIDRRYGRLSEPYGGNHQYDVAAEGMAVDLQKGTNIF